jgi:hypothetical protein
VVTERFTLLIQGMLGQMLSIPEPLLAWTDWYRFAGDVLGYAGDESVEYANLRSVESQNRELLSSGWRPTSQTTLGEISCSSYGRGVHSEDPTHATGEQV